MKHATTRIAASIADVVTDAPRDDEANVTCRLSEFVMTIIAQRTPESAELAATIYKAAIRAWRRNRELDDAHDLSARDAHADLCEAIRRKTPERRRTFNVEVVSDIHSCAGLLPKDILEVEEATTFAQGMTLALCTDDVLLAIGRVTYFTPEAVTMIGSTGHETIELADERVRGNYLCRVVSITRGGRKIVRGAGGALKSTETPAESPEEMPGATPEEVPADNVVDLSCWIQSHPRPINNLLFAEKGGER